MIADVLEQTAERNLTADSIIETTKRHFHAAAGSSSNTPSLRFHFRRHIISFSRLRRTVASDQHIAAQQW